MSTLPGFALMLATVQALTGKTWAGDRVLMSPHSPVDVQAPTLAVYVGHGNGRDVAQRDVADEAMLRIEAFVPKGVTVTDGAGNAYPLDGDGGLDLALAAMSQQIFSALTVDAGPWSALWHDLVLSQKKHTFASDFFETTDDRMIAARSHEITVSLVAWPAPGHALTNGVWPRLLAAMQAAGNDLPEVAPLLEAALRAPAGLASWQIDAGAAGVGLQHASALGLGPADGGDADPAPIAEIAIDDADTGDATVVTP